MVRGAFFSDSILCSLEQLVQSHLLAAVIGEVHFFGFVFLYLAWAAPRPSSFVTGTPTILTRVPRSSSRQPAPALVQKNGTKFLHLRRAWQRWRESNVLVAITLDAQTKKMRPGQCRHGPRTYYFEMPLRAQVANEMWPTNPNCGNGHS